MKIIYIQNKLRPLGQGEEQKNLIFEPVKHTKCALICYKKHRCWRCWLISAMGAKTHQARTITSKLFILHCNGCDFWLDQNVTNCLRRWLFRWLGQLDSLETLVRTMKNDQWKIWKWKMVNWTHWQPWWESWNTHFLWFCCFFSHGPQTYVFHAKFKSIKFCTGLHLYVYSINYIILH